MLRTLNDGDVAPRHLGTALGRTAGRPHGNEQIGQGPWTMPPRVTLREVSLQEGPRLFGRTVPASVQCDWILTAYAAGLRNIGIAACWPPAHVEPDHALEVAAFAATLPDLQLCATARDIQSACRAFDVGITLVTMPLESGKPQELHGVCRARDAAGANAQVEARITVPLDGSNTDRGQARLHALVRVALDAGFDVISLAGTTSRRVDPAQVQRVFAQVCAMAGTTPVSAHLRDAAEGDVATARAASHGGATQLDLALADGTRRPLDGDSPSAVVSMLHAQGVDTGVDLRTLGELREFAARHARLSSTH